MIVVDDPSSPTKLTQETLHSPNAMSSSTLPTTSLPPPSYQNSTALLRSGAPDGPQQQPVEPAGRRFIKAFGVALLVYALLSLVIGTLLTPPSRHFEWGPPPQPHADDGSPVVCNLPWEKPSDDPALSSPFNPIYVPWDTDDLPSGSELETFVFPPYSSRMTMELDSEAPLLYFLARGSLAWGKIRILTEEVARKSESNPKVRIDIDVRYWSLIARNRANICILSKDEGAQGVGIYTPQRWPHKFDDVEKLLFTITVTIPISGVTPIPLSSLETYLPLFKHEIGNLDGKVTFSSLNLKASNAVVVAQSLQVNHLVIQTSNAPISGFFNVTDLITLSTSNGAIDADVDLRSEDQHSPTELNFRTSNARISTAVALHSTKNSRLQSRGGWFNLRVSTSNGRLNVTVPTAPITSHLNIVASTTNGGSLVDLPSAFEGSFALSTSNGALNVADEDPEDPTGQGLKRSIELDRVVRGHVSGRVWWGDAKDHRELGTVRVRTTNGDNILRL
ncbi:hypothetical protein FRC03_006468 [Tulasnella sp. 419]|nr:hypothetical protein FRC02_004556 [Tulasnella sp. 418]KAG8960511.1 hypothetical protein FRC03_006468 [Tulasnella sp. 419]